MAGLYSDQQWRAIVRGFETLGFSVAAYKRPQFERRLESFVSREGFSSVEVFMHNVLREPDLYRRFHTYSTIHVTEFFRDPAYWERLTAVLSESAPRSWRIWSAGCSWGAEPVTLALLLESLGHAYEILATDSDAVVLERARRGQYADADIEKAPVAYRPFFRPHPSGGWTLDPLIQGRITYQQHDVLTGASPDAFDLIVCRNLIIYFEGEKRRQVLTDMARALRPGGLLFLGATETFLEYQALGFSAVAPAIYRQAAPPALS